MVLGWAATQTRMPEPKFNGCKSTRMMGEWEQNEINREWNWSHRWNGRQWIVGLCATAFRLNLSRSSRLCETANRYHAKSKVSNHRAILSSFIKCCSCRAWAFTELQPTLLWIHQSFVCAFDSNRYETVFISTSCLLFWIHRKWLTHQQKTTEKEKSRLRYDKRTC